MAGSAYDAATGHTKLVGFQSVASTGPAVLGLSVCYDLRFPELYRELTARGARSREAAPCRLCAGRI